MPWKKRQGIVHQATRLTRFQDVLYVEFILHDIHVSAVLNTTLFLTPAVSFMFVCAHSDATNDAAICQQVKNHLTVDVITLKLLSRLVLNIVNTWTVPNLVFYFMDSVLCFSDL